MRRNQRLLFLRRYGVLRPRGLANDWSRTRQNAAHDFAYKLVSSCPRDSILYRDLRGWQARDYNDVTSVKSQTGNASLCVLNMTQSNVSELRTYTSERRKTHHPTPQLPIETLPTTSIMSLRSQTFVGARVKALEARGSFS